MLAAGCLVLAGCGSGGTPSAGSTPAPSATAPAHHAAATPVRLHARTLGHLPMPVELPAVAHSRLVPAGDRRPRHRDGLPLRDREGRRRPGPRHRSSAVAAARRRRGDRARADAVRGRRPGRRGQLAGAAHPAQRRDPAGGPAAGGASDVGAAAVGDTVYVVGGYTGTVPLRSIIALGPSGSVDVVAELPRPLRYAAVAAVGGRVLIAAGRRARPRAARSTASIRRHGACSGSRGCRGRSRTRPARHSAAASTCSAGAARTSPRSARRSSRWIPPAGASRAPAGCPRRCPTCPRAPFRPHHGGRRAHRAGAVPSARWRSSSLKAQP